MMRSSILLIVVLLHVPVHQFSPYLPTYDIWNDGALIKEEKHQDNWVDKANKPKDIQDMSFHNATRRRGKSLSVFNFFSFTNEYECQAEDGRRSGLCLNPYSCRRRGGTSNGYCAHGFGVCCVFTVTCGQEIRNNVTYFISPQFPSLSRSLDGCTLMIKKMDEATQLRLDFVHFNMGQPNRLTGECDSDVFIITGGGSKDFKICGQNSDQHIYYDVDKSAKRVMINLKMNRPNLQRFWEIKVMQLQISQSAPAGCMQYFTSRKGYIQTLNYAENGRHLAGQDYKACVRQERKMCSIAYEPCDSRSFRIGPNAALERPGGVFGRPGSFGGAGSEFVGDAVDGLPFQGASGPGAIQGDEVVGSGDGAVPVEASQESTGRQFTRWSPYAQHLAGNRNDQQLWRYWGYGNYGYGVSSFGRQRCQDRIITPCDGDEFLAVDSYGAGICDPYHCGTSLCPGLPTGRKCRVESSVKPFGIVVKFGPPTAKSNPEDNIGACLKYEQLPCVE